MTTWALIGCSKSGAWPPAPAKDVFWPSIQFRGAYKAAVSAGQSPLILTTGHGVVLPEQVIYPFDNQLKTRLLEERQVWARAVLVGLGQHLTPGDQVTSYLCAVYAEFVVPELRDLGYTVDESLQGMTQSVRLQWFREQSGRRSA